MLSVAMFLGSIVLHVLAHSSQEPTSTGDTLSELLIFLSFLAFLMVGVLITSRHPKARFRGCSARALARQRAPRSGSRPCATFLGAPASPRPADNCRRG